MPQPENIPVENLESEQRSWLHRHAGELAITGLGAAAVTSELLTNHPVYAKDILAGSLDVLFMYTVMRGPVDRFMKRLFSEG